MDYWFFHNRIFIPNAVVSIHRAAILFVFLAMITKFSACSVSKVKPSNYHLCFRKRSGTRDGAECVPVRKLIEKVKYYLGFQKARSATYPWKQ